MEFDLEFHFIRPSGLCCINTITVQDVVCGCSCQWNLILNFILFVQVDFGAQILLQCKMLYVVVPVNGIYS